MGGRGWGSGERMDSMEARQSTPHMDNSSFQGGLEVCRNRGKWRNVHGSHAPETPLLLVSSLLTHP